MKKIKFAFFAFALFAFTNNSIAQDKTNNSNIKKPPNFSIRWFFSKTKAIKS